MAMGKILRYLRMETEFYILKELLAKIYFLNSCKHLFCLPQMPKCINCQQTDKYISLVVRFKDEAFDTFPVPTEGSGGE